MYPPFPYRAKEFALIYAGGLFHLFYMRHDLLAPSEDSTEVDFGHAVSSNLAQWVQHDPVLPVRSDHWDNLHVWSPTIICQGDTFYMYYTGVTRTASLYGSLQRIGLATSTDLENWTRYDSPVFGGSQVPWAFADSSQYAGSQFRDPFVMADPDSSDRWHMYYVTVPLAAIDQQIVGVGFNGTGLSPWQDLMPLWNTDAAHFLGFIESPAVFPHDGRWYLFFTTNSGHTIRYQYANSPTADSSAWVGTYRLYDDDPTTDPWFGPELLTVGNHEYFAAVNSANRGIEIREMAWTGVSTFNLVTPAVVGVEEGASTAGGPGITTLGGAGADRMRFRVSLPKAMGAAVAVYDVMGRKIRVLNGGPLPAGDTVLSWDGKNGEGRDVAAGLYFARLKTRVGSRSARAIVLR
jgi:sucrose-6-phosphate hydrolase SacC (GH32 family)